MKCLRGFCLKQITCIIVLYYINSRMIRMKEENTIQHKKENKRKKIERKKKMESFGH